MSSYQIFSITLYYSVNFISKDLITLIYATTKNMAHLKIISMPSPWFENAPKRGHSPLLGAKSVKYPVDNTTKSILIPETVQVSR